MSHSRRPAFRPKLTIEPSGFARGHGHTFGYSGTIGTASGVHSTQPMPPLADAVKKYCGWIERLNYPILDRQGNVVRPAEIKEREDA